MPCSYFYEALENFDAVSHTRAVDCLKYMLLCKIMMNSPDEVRMPSASLSLSQCFSTPLCAPPFAPKARLQDNNELTSVPRVCFCLVLVTLSLVAAAAFATGFGDYQWQAWNAPPGPRD